MPCVVFVAAVTEFSVQSGWIVASADGPFSEIASKKNSSSLNSWSLEPKEVSIAAEGTTEFEFLGLGIFGGLIFSLTLNRFADAALDAHFADIFVAFFRDIVRITFLGAYFGVSGRCRFAARGSALWTTEWVLARLRLQAGKTGGVNIDRGVV